MMAPDPDAVEALDEESEKLNYQAYDEILRGNQEQGEALLRQAYQAKRAAALAADAEGDPRRWSYFREAGRWAIDCHDYAAAEQILTKALAGSPPDDCRGYLELLLEWAKSGRFPERESY